MENASGSSSYGYPGKNEKNEKNEKSEKNEKHLHAVFGTRIF